MAQHRSNTNFRTGAVRTLLCCALVALCAPSALGCARHEAEPAFRASVAIGDRGISVPLPPPSLFDAPKQSVDVHVAFSGDDVASSGLVLNVVDQEGDLDQAFALSQGESMRTLEGLPLDLEANCLELWIADGEVEGEHRLYHASIAADGQTVQTDVGCD